MGLQKVMAEKPKKHSPWMVLVTVIVGTLLIGLDKTVVSLGLPKMIDDFGISVSVAGWISTAYILSNAVFVPVFGKLGDMIGNRKIYLWSFVGFIITSVLAGMSWNISSMVVFRALQGLVGAAIYPTAMSLIAKNFTDQKDRSQALGLWSASFAVSAVLGPLVGGPLIDNYSWRMLFYINLPIGILGIFMVLLYLPNDRGKEKGIFDFYGATALAVSLSSLMLVLEKGQEWDWTSFTSILCYILALFFGALFVYIEKKHPNPMVDLKFFKNASFVSALVVSFISFGGMMGAMFLIPVFVQTYMGYDATQTGFLFLPMALVMLISSPIGAKLSQKIHARYCVSIGMFLTAWAIYMLTGIDPKSPVADITYPLMLLAVGMGIGMAPLTNAVASSVPDHEVGIASAILNLVRNIAGALSIALLGTLLTNTIETKVLEVGANTIINDFSYSSFIPALIVLKAQVLAYREVFLAAATVTAVGAFVALTLKDSSKIRDEKVAVEL